jgi:hypothetical protein
MEAVFLKKNSKIAFWSFKKKDKKSWCRSLWDLQVCKKLIRKSLYFSLSKKDKSAKNSNFETHYTQIYVFVFLLSPKYNEFRFNFVHTNRSHNFLRQEFLSQFFLNFEMLYSNFSKKRGSPEPGSHLSTSLDAPITSAEFSGVDLHLFETHVSAIPRNPHRQLIGAAQQL